MMGIKTFGVNASSRRIISGGGAPPSLNSSLFLLGDNYTSGSWPDSSGNGNDASEGTNPPSLETSALDGHNAVVFDYTSSTVLRVAADTTLDAVTALTIMLAIRITQGSSSGGVEHILAKNGDTSAGAASYSPFGFTANMGSGLNVSGSGWNGYQSGTYANNTYQLLTYIYDGSNYYHRVNGVQVGTGALSGNIVTTTGELTIGALLSFSLNWFLTCKILGLQLWIDGNAPTSGTSLTDQEDAWLAYLPSL